MYLSQYISSNLKLPQDSVLRMCKKKTNPNQIKKTHPKQQQQQQQQNKNQTKQTKSKTNKAMEKQQQ